MDQLFGLLQSIVPAALVHTTLSNQPATLPERFEVTGLIGFVMRFVAMLSFTSSLPPE